MKFRCVGIVCLLLLSFTFCKGQFKSAKIVIDGLTCSMCSYGVEQSMRKLEFVKDVEMDLNANTAQVQFVEGSEVLLGELAEKVRDAGFSVRQFQATTFESLQKTDRGNEYLIGNSICHLISQQKTPEGMEVVLTFIGKDFMDKKTWKKWRGKIESLEKNTGTASKVSGQEYCYVKL